MMVFSGLAHKFKIASVGFSFVAYTGPHAPFNVVPGPFCVAASQLVVAGCDASQFAFAGESASQMVTAGESASQLATAGDSASQIVSPGADASQIGCC